MQVELYLVMNRGQTWRKDLQKLLRRRAQARCCSTATAGA
jgi:hypothetical protein